MDKWKRDCQVQIKCLRLYRSNNCQESLDKIIEDCLKLRLIEAFREIWVAIVLAEQHDEGSVEKVSVDCITIELAEAPRLNWAEIVLAKSVLSVRWVEFIVAGHLGLGTIDKVSRQSHNRINGWCTMKNVRRNSHVCHKSNTDARNLVKSY